MPAHLKYNYFLAEEREERENFLQTLPTRG
jgi:hypothetical protein